MDAIRKKDGMDLGGKVESIIPSCIYIIDTSSPQLSLKIIRIFFIFSSSWLCSFPPVALFSVSFSLSFDFFLFPGLQLFPLVLYFLECIILSLQTGGKNQLTDTPRNDTDNRMKKQEHLQQLTEFSLFKKIEE